MSHEEKMKQFFEKKKHQLSMGGEIKLKALKDKGKLNVRERLEYFFDPGTFSELGLFGHSAARGMAEKTPTDGKIIGYGEVHGRPVAIVANDITILGASSSATNMRKLEYIKTYAIQNGMPLVFFGESSGQRMPDAMGSGRMSQGGQSATQYRRLRTSPWISVLMGPCYGSSSWYAAMSDILVMQKGAVTAVSSPKVTEISTGEKVDPEELGGWKIHAEITGLVDCVGETDEECIDITKELLGYLPTNINENAPEKEVPKNSGQDMPNILNYLPEQRNRVYDMRRIIKTIVDGEEYTELKAGFGRPCSTGFARLGGRSIGIIANNPYFGAGALDADCCEKITSFLVLCDTYNLPIITLIDTPGFLIGKTGERRKVTGKIINWMNALQLVTVPKLTVIIRKIYGQAYLNMGGGRNSDLFVAWPTADISFMDPEPAVNVVYNLKKEDDPERFEKLLQEMTLNTEPWGAAGGFGVQDIIDPVETRDFLIKMLALYQNRLTKGIGNHLMHNWPTSY